MSITKLQSGPEGTPGNMRGTDIADSVNQVIDLSESWGLNSQQVNPGSPSGTQMDFATRGSWTCDGYITFPNYLGINNVAPANGAYPADTGYVSPAADVGAIVSGYDNVCNALAGLVGSQHSIIYSTATHGTILGGSTHMIGSGSNYSTIIGGAQNIIEAGGVGGFTNYSSIMGGSNNTIVSNTTTEDSGFRATIVGGQSNSSAGRNSFIGGGSSNVIGPGGERSFATGASNNVDGSYSFACGQSNIITGSQNAAFGQANDISGTNSFAFGRNNKIEWSRSTSFGADTVSPFNGAISFSSRTRNDVPGNNQALQFTCSNECVDDSTYKSLSLFGSSSLPTQPENSVIDGEYKIVGVNTTTGESYSSTIEFTTTRIGAANASIDHQTTTPKSTVLTLGQVPILNTTTGGIFRIRAKGVIGATVAWSATFVGTLMLFS